MKEKVAVAQNVSKLLSLKNAITSLDIDIISQIIHRLSFLLKLRISIGKTFTKFFNIA